MTSPSRTQLLALIAQLSERYPNWRLGQLIANVAGWADQEIWDADDQQLLAAGQEHLDQLEPTQAATSGLAKRGN